VDIVKNHNEENKKIQRAIQLVLQNGGIEYAYQKMNEMAKEALALIDPLPDSPSKRSLIGLVDYSINRDK
jgi:octaprenyl-diphosphate synthase